MLRSIYTFQRISLGISPKWEHKEIKQTRKVKRFRVSEDYIMFKLSNLLML